MNNNISAPQSFGRDVTTAIDKKELSSEVAKTVEPTANEKSEGVKAPISVTNKKLLNASILESAIKYEGSVADQPQALFLKAALEGINESLKELGMETTIEKSVEEGVDVSPEATADRIVAFSTKFFPTYLKQHPEMDEQEALTKYIDVVSGGVDTGFTEAKEVLAGLNVLEGDIASNIEKTYDLVQQGFSDFVEKYNTEQTVSNEE